MTHEEEKYYKDHWPHRKCCLLNPDAFPDGELDYSDFVCEPDPNVFAQRLINRSEDSKTRIEVITHKITTGEYFDEKPKIEPDTIKKIDSAHMNRICMSNGMPCNCYSFPCNEDIRNQLCTRTTVQYKIHNAAPSKCPFCNSERIKSNGDKAIKLYDIRLNDTLGLSQFIYKRYRCNNKDCKKRLPAYMLPEGIRYIEEGRESQFTTRLQDAVVYALCCSKQPKRISQAYGFSRETAQSIATKKSKELKAFHDAMEFERIKKESIVKSPAPFSREEPRSKDTNEYFTELLHLHDESFLAVFSLGNKSDMRLTYIIPQDDWIYFEHLMQCDFSLNLPKHSTVELNVLLYNYGKCKFPRVDYCLTYLLLKVALSFARTYKQGKNINILALKELKKCLSSYGSPDIAYLIKNHLKLIYILSDAVPIKINVKRALKYISKAEMESTASSVVNSKYNSQTAQWFRMAIEAIEAASTKCDGNAEYIIGRTLYLNSAVLPFSYSYYSDSIISPLDGYGEFWWPYFDAKYEGIPLHCLMHLMKSGLLNDAECPKITCSTEKLPNSSSHPCGAEECPYLIYD